MTDIDKAPAVRLEVYCFDRVVLGYCLLMVALLLAIGRPLTEYLDEIVFYASMAAISALIIGFVRPERNRFLRLIRLLYPGLMFTFFYRATGGMMFLLFDGFYDWQLTALEKAIFGFYPTIYIDLHLLNVWLNEIFSFCYSSYYFMIPVFLLTLFFKKEYEVIKSFLAAACMTFFLSYLLFFLYPIEGPRWHFASEYINAVEGPVFRQITEFFIDKGSVRGGCMPSSHFGVALVILIYCFRYYRRSAWALTLLVAGLAVGTVWGRFHYVSDVVVGGLIGIVAVILTWKYCPIPVESRHSDSKTKEPVAKYAP
ncbi:MAG: phosphatase PAP2 family protein [Candidatus Zixiibacteriota bacterium]|nr:MAG: phosphatase PAP2 family protein [candidate division Zixibacteria bacterium]